MQQSFLYHGLAIGVSGHIAPPKEHIIEVQAPSALPFTGGHSSSRVENYRYDHILSFSSAHTTSTGNESENSFHTLATATIEKLNILNVVTADRVVARLASKYSPATGQHFATIVGSHFENLRIAGSTVKVDIDPDELKFTQKTERVRYGTFAVPVDLEGCRGVKLLKDGGIHIPEFGRIYLAESILTANYQSLTMCRVVLGCAVRGKVAVAHAATNGEPMPG
jgi:hypothetical protein